MKLKNGFHLQTTATHLLPQPPAHNNNQPFNQVNLAVNEIRVSNDERDVATGNDTITIYSLYDDESVEHGRPVDNVDNQFPRPSPNLRFMTNEFGFMELLETDTDSDSSDSPCTDSSDDEEDSEDAPPDLSPLELDPRPQTPSSPSNPSILSCQTCGCFGLKPEFYDENHCTHDCSVITRINECKMRTALEEKEREEENSRKRELEQTEEEASKRIKVEETSVLDNPFRVNDLLEAIDPQHQSLFCPCVVTEVLGYRLLLKFVGYSDKYNFWVNADSINIFPVNWSKKYSESHVTSPALHFHSPPNFISWETYVKANEAFRVAPDTNFPHVQELLQCTDSGIKVGMKVEAVDRRNKNLICVATISCVMGNRFLIHFDSWDSLYDYWTSSTTGDIHPVGYCKEHGIDITPPHCYENASEFDWDEYLKKTNSSAIPPELIKPTRNIPYQLGQTVEVIDKRSPRLLRTAVINCIDPPTQTLSLHFPSLKSGSYDYDICAWSAEIHPSGWGSSTGHPLADDDDEDDENSTRSPSPDSFPVCPQHKICKSVCNVRGPNFPFHSKTRDCPYSTPNMNEYSECGKFTDRVVVFEDAHYDLGVRVNTVKEEIQEELNDKEQVAENKQIKLDLKAYAIVHKPQALLSRNSNPINFNSFVGGVVKSVKSDPQIPKRAEILTWGHDKISNLVQSLCSNLPTAQKVADQFRNNLIDGESFLMLTQSDMTDALGLRLGPAVKIYNLIRLIDLNE